MIYPILHLEDPSNPFIIINDTMNFYPNHKPIYLDPQYNPYETLYNLINDFLINYDDGFNDGYIEGMEDGDYDE